MSRTVKKACIRSPRDVVFEAVELSPLSEDQILVSAIVTGISAGTEKMWFNGTNPAVSTGRKTYPYFPGYEFIGRVAEVGKNVKDVSVGDRLIALAPHTEEVVLGPESVWRPLPQDFHLESALYIPLTMTAIHAAHIAGIMLGDSVGIVGLGVVGLLMVQVAKLAGAEKIIAINPSPWKLEYARNMGADVALRTSDKNLLEAILDETEGRGVDIAIDCSGEAEGMRLVIDIVRRRGKVVVEGFHTQPFTVSGEDLFIKELQILGVRSGGGPDYSYEYLRWSKRANFKLACNLFYLGKMDVPNLVTHRFNAEDILRAYELIDRRQEPYLHIVLDW